MVVTTSNSSNSKNWLKVEKMKVGPDNQHTVVIELKVLCVYVLDQDLKVEEEINSLLNGPDHCISNDIGMLAVIDEQWDKECAGGHIYAIDTGEPFTEGNCFCGNTEAKYIREATEQDHDNFGYNAWLRSRDECEVLDEAGSLPEGKK